MEKDSLMVLSGGMDSVTMLHEYAPSIALAVTFDYGSNHNAREIACARLHCASLGIPLVEIPLEFMGRYFSSSLLTPYLTETMPMTTCVPPSCLSATGLCWQSPQDWLRAVASRP